jgi:methyl-accepting chemotaxis protein
MSKQISNFGPTSRIMLATGVFLCVVCGVASWRVFEGARGEALESNLRLAATVADAAEAVAPRLTHAEAGTVPGAGEAMESLAEAVGLASHGAGASGATVNILASDSVNPAFRPRLGSVEERMLRDLTAAIASGGERSLTWLDASTRTQHFMRLVTLATPSSKASAAFHAAFPLSDAEARAWDAIRDEASYAGGAVLGGMLLFVLALGAIHQACFARPITTLVDKVCEIQRTSDLTRRVPEVGTLEVQRLAVCFNSLIRTLNDIIGEARVGASRIDSGAKRTASTSQSLASGASQQAASIEQISASLEEMSSMSRQSADHAQQAVSLSSHARDAADDGRRETAELTDAMKEILESATKISQIIKTIDDIAFQTNLLALNAAVEAARAGDAGKGFAVVADEVRNLAQRSAEAAKSTSAMIEEARNRADKGSVIAGRVGVALGGIYGGVDRVSTLLTEIAASSKEQATGVSQISRGVSELDKVTQQNAGNSVELAAAAQESAAQVAALTAKLCRFRVERAGNSSPLANAHSLPAVDTSSEPVPLKSPSQMLDEMRHAAVVDGAFSGTTDVAKHAIPFDEHEETFEKF